MKFSWSVPEKLQHVVVPAAELVMNGGRHFVNGRAARSCLMLAAQADRSEITTIEGLSNSNGMLRSLQRAFLSFRALQCGFCTPGVLMVMADLLMENANPSRTQIREALDSNLCRCGSYQGIIDVVSQLAAAH